MPDTTDVTKMPTAGGGMNKPASGTYGEGAALERLRAAFPLGGGTGAPGAAPPQAPPMPVPAAGGGVSTPPTGLPAGLLAPTSQPDVPASTPLAAGPPPNPVAQAQTSAQRNLAIATALLDDPRTSEATKEWAQSIINALVEGSRQ